VSGRQPAVLCVVMGGVARSGARPGPGAALSAESDIVSTCDDLAGERRVRAGRGRPVTQLGARRPGAEGDAREARRAVHSEAARRTLAAGACWIAHRGVSVRVAAFTGAAVLSDRVARPDARPETGDSSDAPAECRSRALIAVSGAAHPTARRRIRAPDTEETPRALTQRGAALPFGPGSRGSASHLPIYHRALLPSGAALARAEVTDGEGTHGIRPVAGPEGATVAGAEGATIVGATVPTVGRRPCIR